MSNQSIESFFAQVNGTLNAIVLACTALTATHPEKEKVLALLRALAGNAAESPDDNETAKRYEQGIREAVATIETGVETARLADDVRSIKSESGVN